MFEKNIYKHLFLVRLYRWNTPIWNESASLCIVNTFFRESTIGRIREFEGTDFSSTAWSLATLEFQHEVPAMRRTLQYTKQ